MNICVYYNKYMYKYLHVSNEQQIKRTPKLNKLLLFLVSMACYMFFLIN